MRFNALKRLVRLASRDLQADPDVLKTATKGWWHFDWSLLGPLQERKDVASRQLSVQAPESYRISIIIYI